MFRQPVVIDAKKSRCEPRMANTAEPERMGREERHPIDAFAVHDLETSAGIGGQLQQVSPTHLGDKSQGKQTLGAVVAGAVTVLESRRPLHKFSQRLLEIAQPDVARFDYMRIRIDHQFWTCHGLLLLNGSSRTQAISDADPLRTVKIFKKLFLPCVTAIGQKPPFE